MSSRVLRAVPALTLGFAAMALLAYAFGRATHTEWVWWLAPLTVALDGSFLLRGRLDDGADLLSPLQTSVVPDLDARICLTSVAAATGMAAWGAYTGSRVALITGAALAILGNTLERGEEPAFEGDDQAGITRLQLTRATGKPSRLRRRFDVAHRHVLPK